MDTKNGFKMTNLTAWLIFLVVWQAGAQQNCSRKDGHITCLRVHDWDQLDNWTSEAQRDFANETDSNRPSRYHYQPYPLQENTLLTLTISESNLTDFFFPNLRISPQLVSVHITNSVINRLSAGTFRGLPKITEVVLINNRIIACEDDAFANLTSLVHLKMNNNSLPIDTKFVGPMTSVRNLDLKYNNTGSFNLDTFPELQSLVLSYCNISKPELFSNVTKLRHLYLKWNNISKLSLSCAKHELENLPCNFRHLKYLTVLDLSENTISDIEPNSFRDLHISYLHLNKNRIKNLDPHAFTGLEQLWALTLADNELEALTRGQFAGLQKLYLLDLQGNRLKHMEKGSLTGLNQLHRLVLQRNELKALSAGVFTSMTFLQQLDLRSNQISTIEPRTFDELKYLKLLLLRRNNLRSVHKDAFFGLESLSGLDLRENEIQHMEGNSFANLPNLQWLGLSGNELKSEVVEPFYVRYYQHDFCDDIMDYRRFIIVRKKDVLCYNSSTRI